MPMSLIYFLRCSIEKHIFTVALLSCLSHPIYSQCFLTGADLSYTNEVLRNGGTYKNEKGDIIEPYAFFAEKGTKIVRLRLWHTPSNRLDYCGNPIHTNGLADILEAAKKVKSNGMKLKIAIHYSDYFADPGKQKRPKAWESLSHPVLLDSIAKYTQKVLQALHDQNTIPDILGIGNETTWGFIDETDQTDGFDWEKDMAKFNAALNAIDHFNQEHNLQIRKAIHFTESSAEWAAKEFSENDLTNFDIIGISFYPYFSPDISINNLGKMISRLYQAYDKEVMVFETGFAWTNDNADNYQNFMENNGNTISQSRNPEGQREYLFALAETIEENKGIGLIYWEPGWITSGLCDQWGQGSSYDNVALFDPSTNKALPAFDFFGYCGKTVHTNSLSTANIKLFPNPNVRQELILSHDKPLEKWILSDTSGHTIAQGILTKEKNDKIHLPNLTRGIYILTIKTPDGKYITEKILLH